MKFFKKTICIITLLFINSITFGSSEALPELKATPVMRAETRYVVAAMEKIHFNKIPLSELDTKLFIKNYISSLDLNHMFFTQTEVEHFYKRFEKSIPLYLKQGNLFPAFEIFKDYLQNFSARIQWIHNRLNQPFDFTKEHYYEPIRKDLPWPNSIKDANHLWTKRLKYEIINELLSSTAEIEENMPKKEQKKQSAEDKLTKTIENVKKRYKTIEDAILKIDASEIQEIYLSTFTQMYDPHSSFLSADTMQDFSASLHNSLVGIGATLSVEDGYVTIRELVPGGPAARQGELKPNDQILAVGEGEASPMKDIVGLKLRQSVNLIRGEEGSTVRLLVKPAGDDPAARKIVTIIREQLKLSSNLAEADFFTFKSDTDQMLKVGLIDIPSFYGPNTLDEKEPATTKDVQELILKMKDLGMQGLILDLRRNGGGLLDEAVSLTGLFIPVGPVVNVQDSKGNIKEYTDLDPKLAWDGPLIILVSKYSASAAEIFAGALKSYNRAIIVGDSSTHGKGTVQVLSEISRPLLSSLFSKQPVRMGATKLTIQKWYLPDGNSTQLKGVPSDIVIPSINETLPISEADLDNPMPWDSIKTLPWNYMDLKQYTDYVEEASIKKLQELSEKRQNTLPEFLFLKKNIGFFTDRQNIKQFSLNLKKREVERKKNKQIAEELEERLKSLAKHNLNAQNIRLSYLNGTEEKTEEEPDLLKQSIQELTPENKDLPNFDIYTRESLRIMSDYLLLKGTSENLS